MLSYETLNIQVKRLVLETMKDGDTTFNLPKVIEHISHNLNDRRYTAKCLAGIGNGHGDIYARIKVGYCVMDISIVDKITACVYYDKSSDYCWNPKRKWHNDVKVEFCYWDFNK